MLNKKTLIIDSEFHDLTEDYERIVFLISKPKLTELTQFLKKSQTSHPQAQYIGVIEEHKDLSLVIDCLSQFRIDNVVKGFAEENWGSLKAPLRHLKPPSAKGATTDTGKNLEPLQKILMAIHKSRSISEIESRLNEVLIKELKVSWVRIFFKTNQVSEQQIENSNEYCIYKVFFNKVTAQEGRVLFAKKINQSFTRNEKFFLEQIAESVGLSIARLGKLQQAETLKQQWETTFDSISEALCLTDTDFNIIRCNQAFAAITQVSYDRLLGKNCFQVFLAGSQTNDFDPHSGSESFRVTKISNKQLQHFEVHCQKVKSDTQSISLVMFKNITANLKLERQILESAKMAELGTIGSSIAHELNNPLGGMINFIQLLRMDLKDNDPIKDDVEEMETAGRRCKEIVESLLGFSRKHNLRDLQDMDLREVIKQSINITEIEIRSSNIELVTELPELPQIIKGNTNLLAQALRNILQNATEAVGQRIQTDPRYKGRIIVKLYSQNKHLIIEVTDNGHGVNTSHLNKIINPLHSTKTSGTHSGLGLTVAYTIIKEHSGSLEVFSQPNIGTTAKISF